MKKYKLINQNGWISFVVGKTYDADYISDNMYPTWTIQYYVNKYPNDWQLVEEFTLPEKWCIKGCYEMKHWQKIDMCDQANVVFSPFYNKWYTTSDPKLLIWDMHDCILPGYTEITFDQFKKYVLKQDTMKIIGYKLKESCKQFNIAAATIEGYIQCGNGNVTTKHFIIDENDAAIEKWNKAEVLNLWFDPIYKEEKKLPKINNYYGSYNNNIVKYGCAEFYESSLRDLYKCRNIGSNRTISEIKLDSGVVITFAQLKEIIDYLDSQK